MFGNKASWFATVIDELLMERIEHARKIQGTETIYDPIEDDPRYRKFLQAAEEEVDEKLQSARRDLGFCHLLWNTKQTILIRRYGVIWFSPDDMNPSIMFD